MEQRISLITLGVRDLPRAVRFYETGLGWKRSPIGGDAIAFFRAGGVVLALFPWAELAADANLPAAGSGFGGVALTHNVARRERVDEILAAAAAAGGAILKPAAEIAAFEGYAGYFADPDGHPWEVAWNSQFPFAADGALILPE
ncbi:MAG: VOC family protein [Thermomicrobiales bacterium]|nr:VOC family protein [Thermomicrobiales bacterium]